jgi:molybdate transport system substrate-binding protein
MHHAIVVVAVVVGWMSLASTTWAADITVFAAGAAKEFVSRIDAPFAQATGHRIKATFDTVGAQRERVERAAPDARPDIVILSSAAIAQLNKLGLIDSASIRDIGDVQVGLAISASAGNASGAGAQSKPTPDISTPEALRATLLAAKSVAYADPARGATAGAHFAKVLAALGITDELANRTTVLPFGVEVIEAVAAGKYELGVSQSSEIVQHKGVRYIGALPAPHRLSTRYQVAAVKDRAAAASLIDFLQTGVARDAMRASGFAASE